MAYRFHTEADRREMLAAIGEPSIKALLDAQVPPECRLDRPLQLPPALPEMALERHVAKLAAQMVRLPTMFVSWAAVLTTTSSLQS